MQKTRELGPGFLLGVVFFLIILGGGALALAESNIIPVSVPPTLPPTITIIHLPVDTAAPSETAPGVTDTPLPTVTETSTPPPPPTNCPPPNGWVAITINANDTLYSLAARYNLTPETLAQQNCLLTADLLPGSIIYVPFVPTIVPTACHPPARWVIYIVQPGDNLYRISLKYRITVAELQRGNCMGASQSIYAGQRLYVPNVSTSTPNVTNTPSPSETETTSPTPAPPSETPAPASATLTPTDTLTPTATP